MKKIMSVKGVLILTLLLVAALGSGTALADRQGAVSPQESLTRTDGGTIVTSNICAANSWEGSNPHREDLSDFADKEFNVWVSGFGAGEVVILSLIKNSDESLIWFSGEVNPAGAAEMSFYLASRPPNDTSVFVRYPGDGIWTLEVFGVSGRLATTPIMTVSEKCYDDSMMMMDDKMMEK